MLQRGNDPLSPRYEGGILPIELLELYRGMSWAVIAMACLPRYWLFPRHPRVGVPERTRTSMHFLRRERPILWTTGTNLAKGGDVPYTRRACKLMSVALAELWPTVLRHPSKWRGRRELNPSLLVLETNVLP